MYIDNNVTIVNVPDNPSTPSEQFVTLIDTQTKITIKTPNKILLIVTSLLNDAIKIVFSLKFKNVTANIMAITKSKRPFLYSPQGVLAQSSKNPVNMAAMTKIK